MFLFKFRFFFYIVLFVCGLFLDWFRKGFGLCKHLCGSWYCTLQSVTRACEMGKGTFDLRDDVEYVTHC